MLITAGSEFELVAQLINTTRENIINSTIMTQTVNVSIVNTDHTATFVITHFSHTTTAHITATVCTFTAHTLVNMEVCVSPTD